MGEFVNLTTILGTSTVKERLGQLCFEFDTAAERAQESQFEENGIKRNNMPEKRNKQAPVTDQRSLSADNANFSNQPWELEKEEQSHKTDRHNRV